MPGWMKNRWGYAAISGFASLIFLVSFFFLLTLFGDYAAPLEDLQSLIVMIIPAPFAAWICWPFKTRRTKGRMALAGILTVVLSLFLFGTYVALSYIIDDFQWVSLVFPVFAVFAGSTVTFGLPYLVAILCSIPFAEADIINE